MDRKAPPWRSVGLRYRRLLGFSDSLSRKFADVKECVTRILTLHKLVRNTGTQRRLGSD